MSAQDIRLRLAIRRHGVPEVKLVWPCPRSPDMTIAKLLTLVNEVVPLESSTWGLEDYAVGLSDGQGGSYECLHFQAVSQALKDEDQVIIRALLTDDIRRRRLSGRHQISTDGKHLVDGLAFGRPWLRAPRDRPSLELPPRKKARIGYEEIAEPVQLLLEGPPEPDAASGQDDDHDEWQQDQDFVEDGGSGSSDDDDPDGDHSPSELDEELKLLAQDNADASDIDPSSSNEATLEQLQVLRSAFPLLSFSTIENELLRQKLSLRNTYDALRRSTAPSLTFDDMMDRMVTGLLGHIDSSPVQPPTQDLFGQRLPATKPLIEVVNSEDMESSTSDSSLDSSSSDEPSSSDEDSEGYEGTSSDSTSDGSSDDSSSDDSSSDSEGSESESERGSVREIPKPTKMVGSKENAPFEGLTRTQKRNARRKRAKLSMPQEATPSDAGDAELMELLRARKEALLGALSEGVALVDTTELTPSLGKETQTPTRSPDELSPAVDDSSTQRRARVDMGAGRRMLFGALGLKNPKSKAEEENIKDGLMKNVKPLNNARLVVEVADNEEIKKASEGDEDEDEWKSKITYRAVECCHEGMVLSEPPFPFEQRWDPQQQYGSMRKRKRASQCYDDSHTEDNSGVFAQETETNGTGNQPRQAQPIGDRDLFGNLVDVTTVIRKESNGFTAKDVEDLPALPEDISSLATLEKGGAKEGMVITWKQCIMSKATQWQPLIASLTGEVLPEGSESGLEVRLAVRDREDREKAYDDKGQRIYDKFDVPDFEDDEDDEDDGYRVVAWDEMIEPRILRDEPIVTKEQSRDE